MIEAHENPKALARWVKARQGNPISLKMTTGAKVADTATSDTEAIKLIRKVVIHRLRILLHEKISLSVYLRDWNDRMHKKK
jgi:hypothetical protein